MVFFIFELIFNLFLIFFLIFLIIDISNFVFRKIPPLPTSRRTVQSILKILGKRKKGTFVDLGCGRGRVLIAVKKKYPEMEVIGYENWLSHFFSAKLLTFLFRVKVKIFFKDLFSANLKETDIVFCYLYPDFMITLEKKLRNDLKKGTLVIVSTFPFPEWQPVKIIVTNQKKPNFEKIFIYEKQ